MHGTERNGYHKAPHRAQLSEPTNRSLRNEPCWDFLCWRGWRLDCASALKQLPSYISVWVQQTQLQNIQLRWPQLLENLWSIWPLTRVTQPSELATCILYREKQTSSWKFSLSITFFTINYLLLWQWNSYRNSKWNFFQVAELTLW